MSPCAPGFGGVGAMAVSMLRMRHSSMGDNEGRDGVRLSARNPNGASPALYQFNQANSPARAGYFGGDSRRGRKRRGTGNMSAQKSLLYVANSVVEPQKPINFLRVLVEGAIAGATAGVVVETALYPIDTIKTRLQAARSGGKIVFKGLYSGLAGNLAGVLPASAIFVGVYEPMKRKLLDIFPDHLSSVAHLTAGAAGGATASLIRVPTEVVKQRMQTGQFPSAHSAVRQILAKEGVRGLYAGFGSFLLRDLPFDAIQFCIYEQLRLGLKKVVNRDLLDLETALVGATSGAITGAVTTPLDVIKTRLMTQGAKGHYKGIGDCVSKIIQEEGAGALLKGIGPRVMWIGIGGSIFFAVLERTKQLLAARVLPEDLKDARLA
ncbi:S-adenosylmethionine carrier 1, chloroplastic/mitochondrial isoform X1 [Physcomitrium patens]|uniref:S-adenosylmethionine transporter n=2 Tax=Physcomitrium patens TaxID=3218 RepID=A0A2K1JQA1_PHYPA|nr:S-adenosylmethionine carrier 1, chloroplastic/mitochondrial-like [Physcomitrium patens]PNR43713.1 hypothetical protein PHYPA_016095 [Physcomitrium patens]|eukprot:XP_024391705.1 S-adenosylmethionine carrier 1, chloroplastic/mitochondrial-like [Physcomitrella patens]